MTIKCCNSRVHVPPRPCSAPAPCQRACRRPPRPRRAPPPRPRCPRPLRRRAWLRAAAVGNHCWRAWMMTPTRYHTGSQETRRKEMAFKPLRLYHIPFVLSALDTGTRFPNRETHCVHHHFSRRHAVNVGTKAPLAGTRGRAAAGRVRAGPGMGSELAEDARRWRA